MQIDDKNTQYYMKAGALIDECISNRIQFLETLMVISSYQEVVTAIPSKLLQQSQKLTEKQTETILQVLRTFRVDDKMKKDLHRVILRNFKRIENQYNTRTEPTGVTKDIVADYTKFFMLMKEKNILQFLGQIFDIHIYSQATIVYVLIEVLFKFLRIKCTVFIQQKIKQNNNHHHTLPKENLTTNQIHKQYSVSNSNRSRLKSMPHSFQTKKQSKQFGTKCVKKRESFSVNCQTIAADVNKKRQTLSRLRSRKTSLCQSKQAHSNSLKTKRRVIKSFVLVKEETNQRIQRNYSLMRQWVGTGMQTYLKNFTKVYRKQWNDYLKLVCVRGEDEEKESYSNTKKKEWMEKNKQKMMFQACSRNDQIRKQMEKYADSYNSKFKN